MTTTKKDTPTALVAWYRQARRPMPWRLAPSPYTCWLSEIMMQQTTYDQALPYFRRFLERFPAIEDLAAANEQDVLKAWEGLGYYARARNLLKAAKAVAAQDWPTTYDGWLDLPGVGPYTAAALASVLNGARTPVVDGNVARVFARYWRLEDDFKDGTARQQLAARLAAWMGSAVPPGDFNQAMMELGALVCTPAAPHCTACPLATTCAAHAARREAEYPKNAKRGAIPVRQCTYLVVRNRKGEVLLAQRTEKALLKGLWELPTVAPGAPYRQTFTHFKLEAEVVAADSNLAPVFKDPRKVPLTTAARRILEKAGLLTVSGRR